MATKMEANNPLFFFYFIKREAIPPSGGMSNRTVETIKIEGTELIPP
jgi:hypothetical protein